MKPKQVCVFSMRLVLFICGWDLLSVCRLMGAVLWRWLVKGFLQNHGDLFFSRTPACMSMRDSESVLHIVGSAQWTRTHGGPSWIEDWHSFVQGFGQFPWFEDEYRPLLHVGACVSMVRKIPVCWRHLAFWETSSSVSYIVELTQHVGWFGACDIEIIGHEALLSAGTFK